MAEDQTAASNNLLQGSSAARSRRWTWWLFLGAATWELALVSHLWPAHPWWLIAWNGANVVGAFTLDWAWSA